MFFASPFYSDLNPSVNVFERKFVEDVRRCEDMERRLRYLGTQVHRCRVSYAHY